MPHNPYKAEKEARQAIKTILIRKLPEIGCVGYLELQRQILEQYEVSKNMPINYIKQFYIDAGSVDLVDGILYPSGGKEYDAVTSDTDTGRTSKKQRKKDIHTTTGKA